MERTQVSSAISNPAPTGRQRKDSASDMSQTQTKQFPIKRTQIQKCGLSQIILLPHPSTTYSQQSGQLTHSWSSEKHNPPSSKRETQCAGASCSYLSSVQTWMIQNNPVPQM